MSATSMPRPSTVGAGRFRLRDRGWVVSRLDAGEPITALAGVHSRLLRAVRARADPDHQRPEGQEGRHPGPRLERAPVPGDHGGARRARPPAGHRLGQSSPRPATPWSCSPPASRCLSRLPARAAGAARPQHRRGDPQHHLDKPWSQYFCCMLSATGTSSAIIRSRPSAPAGRPQGRRHLRHRAGEGGATSGRWRVRPRYDYALQTLTELPYDRWREFDPEDACASTRCACTRSA